MAALMKTTLHTSKCRTPGLPPKCRGTPILFYERWRNHSYYILLYESGIDPLVAMKIVGHTDYQTTANIYTHIKEEMLKKATVDLEGVFRKRAGKE